MSLALLIRATLLATHQPLALEARIIGWPTWCDTALHFDPFILNNAHTHTSLSFTSFAPHSTMVKITTRGPKPTSGRRSLGSH